MRFISLSFYFKMHLHGEDHATVNANANILRLLDNNPKIYRTTLSIMTVNIGYLGPYSQHFIFIVTYEQAQ